MIRCTALFGTTELDSADASMKSPSDVTHSPSFSVAIIHEISRVKYLMNVLFTGTSDFVFRSKEHVILVSP